MSIGLEPIAEVTRKREEFDGGFVAVVGTLQCKIGLDLDAHGRRVPGLIAKISDVEILEGPGNRIQIDVSDLRQAREPDEVSARRFVEDWMANLSKRDKAAVARGMGDRDRFARTLSVPGSRENWILFDSPKALAKRLDLEPSFCGVYEYKMTGLPFKELAYCVDESGKCGNPGAPDGVHLPTWLTDGPAYCVQVGTNDSGRLWISDSGVY
jgi:hypothetical protein